MIRLSPLSIGCMAAMSFTAAWAQNGALTTNEVALRANEATAAAAAAPLIAADRQRPRLGGFWEPEKAVDTLVTADGKAPPMTAAGRQLFRERSAALRVSRADDPMEACLPPGTPRDMLSPGPLLITQTPAKVTIFHEFRHLIRHVHLDGPLKLEEPDPWWQGHFSGYWDGDVLIVETGGFNGQQWLDKTGLPQSPDMKVVERFKLIAPNTLEDVITVEDAKYYSKPWTTRLTFRRLPEDLHLIQEECAEKLLEFPLRAYAPGG
jgi:hypothetical protein